MKLSEIKPNPDNPRIIRDENFSKLKKSIQEFPQMMEKRPIVVNENNMILGGNMRFRALQDIYGKNGEIPDKWVSRATGWTEEQKREFVIKDNAAFGEWDWDSIANKWNDIELSDVGLEFPKDWQENGAEKKSLCDMVSAERMRSYGDISVLCSFKKSKTGKPLADIKAEKYNINVFADAFVSLARKVAGLNTLDDWCLVTAPKRRHKEENFSEAVCKEISSRIGIKFYPDVFTCKDKTRILPTFTMEYEIKEANIILYDDIITTGSTIRAMADILRIKGKNVLYFAGILND